MRRHHEPLADADTSPATPALPRLAEPELRSRLAGYLAHAAPVAAGYRSDGAWVWPERLAESVLAHGVGPERDLLHRATTRRFEAPAELPEPILAQAREVLAAPAPLLADPAVLYYVDDEQGVWQRAGGSLTPLVAVGAVATVVPAPAPPPPDSLIPITPAHAAHLLDEATRQRYEYLVADAAETAPGSARPWAARVFDAQDADARPWFSPRRLRIDDASRRDRIAGYLARGRLVVRATGRAVDPLVGGDALVVPLGWRTDGVWVWQDALTYYLRGRGIAPELALLRHIEERGYAAPDRVSDAAALAAAQAVRHLPPTNGARRPTRYYRRDSLLVRASVGDGGDAEVLDPDLRWRPAPVAWLGEGGRLRRISEVEATRVLDARCLNTTVH